MVVEYAEVYHPEFIVEYLEEKKNMYESLMQMIWRIAYKNWLQQKRSTTSKLTSTQKFDKR
jgi:hypothetical protein